MHPPGTETLDPQHAGLDQYPSAQLLAALIDDHAGAVAAVQAVAADLARAVDAAVPRIRAGGRLIHIGAGTSGRLGVLDSVELQPTFSWPHERGQALIAGGHGAMFQAVEGAEDDAAQGAADLQALAPTANDVLLLIAASGTTPYVLGALQSARACGALTIGLANNRDTALLAAVDIGLLLDTGAEVIAGSTRLKAGTAQKIALNSFSSALMVRLHKVHGNLMVDLRASNAKLRGRAIRLAMLAGPADALAAEQALRQCGWRVKVAIVMLRSGRDAVAAQQRLDQVDGSVRAALAE